MDTNTTIIAVALLIVVVILSGFLIYRRKTKVDLEVSGNKFGFEGENDSKPVVVTKKTSRGIFGNLSIGKTRMKVVGNETIEGNKNIGDTELTAEEKTSQTKEKKKK
ncbi:MAG: hypothetical protein J0M11_01900 [Anaerolineae bacterium]|nr:hypothetical protein [Anaerolineae bacterium]